MIHWNTHIVRPEPNQTAIIAACCPMDDQPFLLPEIYRWDEKHQCWMAESTGLKLKQPAYFWLPEEDVLEAIP